MKKLSESQRLVLRSVAEGDRYGKRLLYARNAARGRRTHPAVAPRVQCSLLRAGLLQAHEEVSLSGYKSIAFSLTDAGRAALAEEEYVASMAAFAAEVSKP